MQAVRPPKPQQQRREHAPRPDSADYALCGARLTETGDGEVTCNACVARLRDAGKLPMTRHAKARRSK